MMPSTGPVDAEKVATQDDKPVPPKVREDPAFALRMGNRAAFFVVICSIGFVIGMLLILYFQLNRIENSAHVTAVDAAIDAIVAEPLPEDSKIGLLGQLIMESDAQFLRTERAQSLVGARLTVMIIAELIGLSLVVLGGAFIFARVRGEGNAEFQKGSEIAAKLASEFPGIFLCAFGTILVIWALNTSVDDNSRTTTTDRPLFFPSSYEISSYSGNIASRSGRTGESVESICKREAPNPADCE